MFALTENFRIVHLFPCRCLHAMFALTENCRIVHLFLLLKTLLLEFCLICIVTKVVDREDCPGFSRFYYF